MRSATITLELEAEGIEDHTLTRRNRKVSGDGVVRRKEGRVLVAEAERHFTHTLNSS